MYKENTRELNWSFMGSEWKSDEKLLIFVSLISPAKILLFEK